MKKIISLTLCISLLIQSTLIYANNIDIDTSYLYDNFNEEEHDDEHIFCEDTTIEPPIVEVTPTIKTRNLKTINLENYYLNQPVLNKTITIKEMDNISHLNNLNTYRGDTQAREIIPFEIKEGETITLKQTNGLNQRNLEVDLITDIVDTNIYSKSLLKSGEELNITANTNSVCYIRIPRNIFSDITVEYSITNATSLPIYTQNISNSDIFFAEWDTLGTYFSILKNDVVKLQAPDINKDYLKDISNKGSFNNLDHLLQYYQEMVDYFDYTYGLDNSTDYNYKATTQYLVAPNRKDSSIVGIYWRHIVVACGSRRGLLAALDDSWLAKHELAHGYQGDMMNGVSVAEIWNNIPTHYYSMNTNSNNTNYKTKYNNIDKPKNQKYVYDKAISIQNGNTTSSFDLNFFREIFDTFGLEVFIKFNQEYRRLAQTKEHQNYTNVHQFEMLFSKYAGVDLIPLFDAYGFNILEEAIVKNNNLPKAYFLTDIVNSSIAKNYIIDNYNLSTEYALVDTSIFNTDENLKNITGNLYVNIEIANSEELDGKQVLLKNGDFEIYSPVINNKATFTNIPVGIYNISFPLTNSGDYIANQSDFYILIAENETANYDINYETYESLILNSNYNIIALNSYNNIVSTATIKPLTNDNFDFKFNVVGGRANSDASGIYSYLEVYDNNNVKIFEHKLSSDVTSEAFNTNFQIGLGYKIILYRSNVSRKYHTNLLLNEKITDSSTRTLTYEITKNGVLVNGKDIDLKNIINQYTLILDNLTNINYQYDNQLKRYYLKNAINLLDEETKLLYLNKYKNYLRFNNPIISTNIDTLEIQQNDTVDFQTLATATDFEDGDITYKVTTDSSLIDLTKEGTYSVEYKVLDSDYNYAVKVLKVIVTKPVVNDITDDTTNIIVDNNTNENLVDNINDNNNDKNNTTDTIIDNNEKDDLVDKVDDNNENNTSTDNIINDKNTSSNNIINNDDSYDDNNENNTTIPNKIDNSNIITDKDNIQSDEDSIIKYLPLNNVAISKSIVPYYFDENNNQKIIMFSTIKNNDLVLIDKNNKSPYLFKNNSKYFTDIFESWAKENINFVTSRDILIGYEDNTFKPDLAVNRAMIVTVLARLSEANVNGYPNIFSDVAYDSWYKDYIAWAKNKGIINGVDQYNFNPEDELTREQLAVILANYIELLGYKLDTSNQPFNDNMIISDWSIDSVYKLKSIGLLKGDEYNNFNPTAPLTRAELSAVIERLIEYIINENL